MHHWWCSGVRTRGLTSTHGTNTARKYCKMVPYACEGTTCFPLLSQLRCGSTTVVLYTVVSCITGVLRCPPRRSDKYTSHQHSQEVLRNGGICLQVYFGVPAALWGDAMQHSCNAVSSSLMHHWGCSGVRTGGLTSTHDTNTARKYCETAPYACGCTLGFPLLSAVMRSSTTVRECAVVSCITGGAQVSTPEV
jgi:hypothetical protein